jgi:hypothetical protein
MAASRWPISPAWPDAQRPQVWLQRAGSKCQQPNKVPEKQSSAGINYRAFFYCLFDGLAVAFLGEEVEFAAAEAVYMAFQPFCCAIAANCRA